MSTHTYTHTPIYACTHIHIRSTNAVETFHKLRQTHMSTHVHTCMHIYIYAHAHAHMHAHAYINAHTCTYSYSYTYIHVTRHFSLKSCIGRLFGGTNEPHVWLCSRCRSGILSELLISGSASNNITSSVSCVKIQPNTLLAHMFMHVRACMYEYACVYSCVCVRVRVCTCVCAIGVSACVFVYVLVL
jgi:hypothetical protein